MSRTNKTILVHGQIPQAYDSAYLLAINSYVDADKLIDDHYKFPNVYTKKYQLIIRTVLFVILCYFVKTII